MPVSQKDWKEFGDTIRELRRRAGSRRIPKELREEAQRAAKDLIRILARRAKVPSE
ncbi:MAG TPA: hypothetical protein VLB73_00620 [Patescibacteria group bacterium]|nr:hypothetical protein [Patescibacteria group bacterium]